MQISMKKSNMNKTVEHLNHTSNQTDIDGLCLSGGAWKGVEHLGALHFYSEKNIYNADICKIYGGTSVGSIICLLLVSGYSPMEIFKEVYTLDSIVCVQDINVWDLIKNFGLMNINSLMDKITCMVKEKFNGMVPSLETLYKTTKKILLISVANVTDKTPCYLSYVSAPHMSCVDAVKISCNLPVICTRLRYKGKYFGDGGLTDNLPFQKVLDYGAKRVLCILTCSSTVESSSSSILNYIYNVIMIPVVMNTDLRFGQALRHPDVKTLAIDSQDRSIDTSLSSEEKMTMFLRGYEQAQFEENLLGLRIPNWSWTCYVNSVEKTEDLEGWDIEF